MIITIILEINMLYMVKVRSQDASFGLAVSLEGRDVAWEWLKVWTTQKQYMKCEAH